MGLQGYVEETLILEASADETLSSWVNVRGRTTVSFFIRGTGTTSSGVISLEESQPDKQGIWAATPSVITTVNASTVSAGVEQAVHVSPAAFGYVRARISTVIGGGGTVTVVLVAS